MESDAKLREGLAALLAMAGTALLVFFGNGLEPLWPLMWLAPVPVLLYALRNGAWRGAAVAFAAWMVGGLNLWSYMRGLGIPAVAWVLAYGTGALAFASAVLLMRALARRGALWSAWLSLPAAWVTFEYVRNLWLWPHGSAASLAYSQLNFLPFLQLASLTGPWGMSFVLLLFPAGLALGARLWVLERRQAMQVLGATAAVVGVVLIYGAVRLAGRQPGPVVRVGLVASDISRGVTGPGAPAQGLFEEYAKQAQELIARGAQVVVMPENLAVVVGPNIAQTDTIFQEIADSTGAALVVGMNHGSSTRPHAVRHNEARIYAPGAPVRSFYKEHLLPPFESMFTPGTSRTVLRGMGSNANETWGVAICKDLDFTEPARGYGRSGVGLLLAPAWDFQVDAFWHGHIAIMRAVEDGFSLVRSARDGFLTVVDDRGRVLAETRSNSAPFATLQATVPAGHDNTLFQRWGDWAGWGSIVLLVAALTRMMLNRGPRTI